MSAQERGIVPSVHLVCSGTYTSPSAKIIQPIPIPSSRELASLSTTRSTSLTISKSMLSMKTILMSDVFKELQAVLELGRWR